MLPKGTHGCNFCDFSEPLRSSESSTVTQGNLALNAAVDAEWRGELNQRVQAYRARRRKPGSNEAQTELPFAQGEGRRPESVGVRVEQAPLESAAAADDFAFTVAIGRCATREREVAVETQYFIDVSLPPKPADEMLPEPWEQLLPECAGLYPVASLAERRRAALIDAACLAFAYGGFLALFGSLGGHFALSKLNAAVYFFTFAFVYLQYFGLFTIFGGTTPGMMIGGLQVATFSGEEPGLRHLLFRAAGYLLSAGTLFLGFLWALWDEDALTWHDRISRTYLRAPEIFAELDESHPVVSR